MKLQSTDQSPRTTASFIQNPQENYRGPFEILQDNRLSKNEKKKALENWEADVRALLRADDENMACLAPQKDNGAALNDSLKKIQQVERQLNGGK